MFVIRDIICVGRTFGSRFYSSLKFVFEDLCRRFILSHIKDWEIIKVYFKDYLDIYLWEAKLF